MSDTTSRLASWTDLANPVYKGAIVMPNPASSGTGYQAVYAWIQIMGEKAAWEFMDKLHENVAVYMGNDRHWYVEFRTKCKELGDDHRCGIYETRPELCRAYEVPTCPRWASGLGHVVRFETEREYADYLALPPGKRPGARPRRASSSPRRPRPARGRARSGGADPKRGRSPRR